MMRRMLIVDDEETIRWALCELFMQDGWEVHSAADGDEAARMIGQSDYDFMITDLKMPGRPGVDVVRQARRHSPLMGIVILTGYASLETAIEAVRLRVWDYVTKPCDAGYLKQRIDRFVEEADREALRPEAPECLAPEDFVRFLQGAGTEILPLSPAGPTDHDSGLFTPLQRMFADLGFRQERAAQLIQFCVETVASLAEGACGRAGLLKGHVLVGITGQGAQGQGCCEMLHKVTAQFNVDARVIESDSVYSVVLSEGLRDEGPGALRRWNAQAQGVRKGAGQAPQLG